MNKLRKYAAVAVALGAVAVVGLTPAEAEARRYRVRTHRPIAAARFYNPRVYYGRAVTPYRYGVGYRGYGRGYGGGVRIGAPGVGISIGW